MNDINKFKRMGIDIPKEKSILNSKQKKMLNLLVNEFMSKCEKCIHHNSKTFSSLGDFVPPYIGENYSGVMILGEAPGKDEVIYKEPFVGKAGDILWKAMEEYGFSKSDFIIWNTMNCRPIKENGGNGKPDNYSMYNCYEWFRKAIKIVEPKIIMLLGSFPMRIARKYFGTSQLSVKKSCGIVEENINTKILHAIHPASCIYNYEENIPFLYNSLEKLKEIIEG